MHGETVKKKPTSYIHWTIQLYRSTVQDSDISVIWSITNNAKHRYRRIQPNPRNVLGVSQNYKKQLLAPSCLFVRPPFRME